MITVVFVVVSLLLPASGGRGDTVPVCYQIKVVFSLSTVIIAVSLSPETTSLKTRLFALYSPWPISLSCCPPLVMV